MRSQLGLLVALATVATGSWLGDEYWTLIGPRGQPIQGKPENFARVAHYFKPDEHNRFVAFWMTNTHYAGRMYEQFGEAFLNEEEEKYCARFTGERGETVETCENFRILSVPEQFKGRTIFEWVKIDATDGVETDKIGYNDHRICAFAYDPSETAAGVKYTDFTFGDAVPSTNVAKAVNRLLSSNKYHNYFLRLLVGENQAQSRLPSPPQEQHVAHRQHQQRQENVQHTQHNHHQQQQQAQEQQAQQDAEYQRRLAEYNERLRQQQLQQQQRDQYEQQQQSQQVQAHVQQVQQQQQQRFICDTYGRVFETKTGEDGRTRYVTYNLAAHGGVRPACTLIGETPGVQPVRQEGGVEQQLQQRQPEQRPYPVRRSCSGYRQKKDAEDDC